MAHLHAPAANGVDGGVIVPLCGNPLTDSPCYLTNTNRTQTFSFDLPLKLLDQGMIYLNLHTAANINGELRGQLAGVVNIPSFQRTNVAAFPSPNYQNATEILSPSPNAPISFSVPLSVGQEPNANFDFTATPEQEGSNKNAAAGCPAVQGVTPQPRATFSITINPSGRTSDIIIFSAITVTSLTSTLKAAHIHGPCEVQKCNAPVVFTICDANCPGITSGTIPGFTVNQNDFSTLSLLNGSSFYYVNIHTINSQNGEVRADLVIPRGTATVAYTRTATPVPLTLGLFPRISVVPAVVTISVVGLSGNVQQIHLHGPAGFGQPTGILVDICTSEASCGLGALANTRTFQITNWPINVAAIGNTYFNVHTVKNQLGEVRGQVVRQIGLPNPATNGNGGALNVVFYTDNLCTIQPTASAAQTLPIIGNFAIPGLNLPAWAVPNPFVAKLSTCTPAGSRVGSNGQNVTVFSLVSQCSLQEGAILQTFSDNSCTIPFTPAELIPANSLNQCIEIFPPGSSVAAMGLYVRDTCAGNVTLTIPVSAFQQNAVMSFAYRATTGQQIPPPTQSCATASFNITFNPATSNISFSDIEIKGLRSPLDQVHMHGPCRNNARCNAPVVYWICHRGQQGVPAGVPLCPTGSSPVLPAFFVDKTQNENSDNSLLAAIFQDILSGSNLYYVNFHTTT
jgi:hypothetical protein